MALQAAGLATEVRYGDPNSLLVFVKMASEQDLKKRIYRSRLDEWLHDTYNLPPSEEIHKDLKEKPISEAERLRFVYKLITVPEKDGGQGITPNVGEWKFVESIFPLHDRTFNKKWIKKLSTKYYLRAENFSEIKDQFGERIAFYFAFLQTYFLFLTFPAVFGFFAWLFLKKYSPVYALFNGLWCVIFVEYWKKQEKQLAVKWGTINSCKNSQQLLNIEHESSLKDPATRATVPIYSLIQRLLIKSLQIPFAGAAAIALGGLIAACFAIEVFISEIYNGPLKFYLVLLPTIILTTVMPAISVILTKCASKLTDLENYKSQESYEASMTHKIFLLNFITSYLPLILTAFVYVPFGRVLAPYFKLFHPIVNSLTKTEEQVFLLSSDFTINKDRLKSQAIYYTLTGQIINFALEAVVPCAKRKVFSKLKEVKTSRNSKRVCGDLEIIDNSNESTFLTRVRNEANMEKYNVTSDFREMVIQFGYLSLFSIIWPLTATSFLINNWFEIRGDAIKIAMETQRPIPRRADSIGSWINALGFLAWLGSLTTAALLYLFSGDGLGPDGAPWDIKVWGLLMTILLSENLYLVTQICVRKLFSKVDSCRRCEMSFGRSRISKVHEKSLKQEENFESPHQKTYSEMDKIATDVLENTKSLKHNFWNHQSDPLETINTGRSYIVKAKVIETKKEL
ncbi:uncharacterized protein GcM1_244016 [Golovinomyces cichoracearum]|uniref:Plasma membrane channel protein n=1 Tax=Golovinomyces cichoracearum TaxID=62708 RepID=A0A420IFJ2_9PEZI|nr:uncharacterized protein GcM1_244016 [Golovinomyces cichoracearum]